MEKNIERSLKKSFAKSGITATVLKMDIDLQENTVDWRVHHIDNTPIEYGIKRIPTREGYVFGDKIEASFEIIPPKDEKQRAIFARHMMKVMGLDKPLFKSVISDSKINDWLRQEAIKKQEEFERRKDIVRTKLLARYSDYHQLIITFNRIEKCLGWHDKFLHQKINMSKAIQSHLDFISGINKNFQSDYFWRDKTKRIDRIRIILEELNQDILNEQEKLEKAEQRMRKRLESNVSLYLTIVKGKMLVRNHFYLVEKARKRMEQGVYETSFDSKTGKSQKHPILPQNLGMDTAIWPIRKIFERLFPEEDFHNIGLKGCLEKLKDVVLQKYPELADIPTDHIKIENYDVELWKIEKQYKAGLNV